MKREDPDPIDTHVGNSVRVRRMLIGISQQKLGEHLGITFQQVQKYEKGTNRISASRLQEIARILKVSVAHFFKDAPGGGAGQVAGGAEKTYGVVDFLSTTEGIRLNKAFVRIKDAKLRHRLVDLVKAIVGDGVAPH